MKTLREMMDLIEHAQQGPTIHDYFRARDELSKIPRGTDEHTQAVIDIQKLLKAVIAAEKKQQQGVSEESEKHECPHCHGSGRMVRDPDIGTDQECFVCDGTGYVDQIDEASPEAIARIHKLSQQ